MGIEFIFDSSCAKGLRLRKSILNDQEAMDFLSMQGLISSGPGGCIQPEGGLGLPNGEKQALFFEWVLAHRRANLLDQFSLGPTQIYLGLSPVAITPSACGHFDTWDDMFDFWTSVTIKEVMDRIVYLEPPCTSTPYPSAPGGDPRAKGIAWLTHHTGNTAAATAYYDGSDLPPNIQQGMAFSNSIFLVNKQASALGY